MKMTVASCLENDDLEYALYEDGADVRTDDPIRVVTLKACDYPDID